MALSRHPVLKVIFLASVLPLISLFFPAPLGSQSSYPLFQSEKPFGLPFADPPGPSTWLFGQGSQLTTLAILPHKAKHTS